MTTTTHRIAVGGIAHETHSFATRPTGLEDFRKQALFFGDDILAQLAGGKSATAGMIDNARADWQLLPTVYAGAMPGGIVTTEAFETIVGELTARLAEAMPLDGVLLALHGAMVTEDELDAESAILQAVRDVVGNETPIVITLDMHGNISPRTVELVDVLIAFDENPHIDPYERGAEAADVMGRLLSGEIQPDRGLRAPAVDSGAPGDRHGRSAAGGRPCPRTARWRPRMPWSTSRSSAALPTAIRPMLAQASSSPQTMIRRWPNAMPMNWLRS